MRIDERGTDFGRPAEERSDLDRPTPSSPAAGEELRKATVNEVVERYPASLAVFHRHGMDACCGGSVPVEEAAARDGADLDTVLAELQEVARGA